MQQLCKYVNLYSLYVNMLLISRFAVSRVRCYTALCCFTRDVNIALRYVAHENAILFVVKLAPPMYTVRGQGSGRTCPTSCALLTSDPVHWRHSRVGRRPPGSLYDPSDRAPECDPPTSPCHRRPALSLYVCCSCFSDGSGCAGRRAMLKALYYLRL